MQIQFLPMNKKIITDVGINLMECAVRAGVGIQADCAGNGTCGKCKVIVSKGNRMDFSPTEIELLTKEERSRGMRLACQVHVTQDCCIVVMDEPVKMKNVEVISYPSMQDRCCSDDLGVVLDLGTTSLEMALIGCENGAIIARATMENPQRVFGADVISRISYGSKSEKHLNTMSESVRNSYNLLVEVLVKECLEYCSKTHRNCKKIDENTKEMVYNKITKGVVLGNTTMSHIFLKQSVMGLAKAPFSPAYEGYVRLENTPGSFHMHPEGTIMIVPYISGHVGADTVGCLIETRLWEKKGNSLLIDIGTNGEMVLARNGELICCSTAAGPAFEGASIVQGMRAAAGAIRGVSLVDGNWELDVVGNESPIGICGSGIIDILAIMLQEEIIDETGRIQDKSEVKEKYESRIIEDVDTKFLVNQDSGKNQVYFTQHDIREIQLAKAAIYAGVMTLLEESGLALNEIDTLYLAGAFGSNITIANAIRIGLLPPLPENKVILVGNGSLLGGIKILQEEVSEKEIIDLVDNIRHIELANHEDFRQRYIDAINF